MSFLKDKLKELIKQEYLKQRTTATSSSKYRIGTISAMNEDGTCLAMVDGASLIATPMFPVVQGQEVMVVFGDSGKISVIPTKPNTPPIDILTPPYFSGSVAYRFLSSTFPLSFDNANTWLKFQDKGSSNVYVYDAGHDAISEGSALCSPVLSPNGQHFAYVEHIGADKTYKIHSVKIGSTLTSSDAVVNDHAIDDPLKIFAIKSTENFTISSPTLITFADPGLDNDGILDSDFILLDLWVDNSGTVYWMETQEDFWSLAFGITNGTPEGNWPSRSTRMPVSGFVRIWKYDGTIKTKVTELSLFTEIVSKISVPTVLSLSGTSGEIFVIITSNCPVPLAMADPVRGLIFAGASSTGGPMFSITSFNTQKFIAGGGATPIRQSTPGSTVAAPPGTFVPDSYSPTAIPVVMDGNTGQILASGNGVLGSASTGNHSDPLAIGARVISPGFVNGSGDPLIYKPTAIINYHRATTTSVRCLWWIDDVTLRLFGFKVYTKTDPNSGIITSAVDSLQITNSMADLNFDTIMDFRTFWNSVFPFNHLFIDKSASWVECSGIENAHFFNPQTHRHIRKLKFSSGVIIINPDTSHISSISPGDLGGYPIGSGDGPVGIQVASDANQWRELYDPSDDNVGVNESLLSVSIIS